MILPLERIIDPGPRRSFQGTEDCGITDLVCHAGEAAASILVDIANGITDFIGLAISSMSTLWINVDPPELTKEGVPAPGAGIPGGAGGITTVLGYVTWVGIVVAVLSLIILGAGVAINQRRGEGIRALGQTGLILGGVILISSAASLVSALLRSGPASGLSGPVGSLQSMTWWFTAAAAALSVIMGGIKMAWDKRADPGKQVLKGILTLIVVSGSGVVVISTLMTASDEAAKWILDESIKGCSFANDSECFGQTLAAIMIITPRGVGVIGVIVVGLLGLLVSIVQIVILLARNGMLIILAGTIALPAALSSTESGRNWLQKFIGWTIAFLLYKPAAAIIYASAFLLIGGKNVSDGIASSMSGMMLMVLAIVVLPALMRFTTPMVGAIAGAGAGIGGAVAGALPTGAMMLAKGSSVGAGAVASGATKASGGGLGKPATGNSQQPDGGVPAPQSGNKSGGGSSDSGPKGSANPHGGGEPHGTRAASTGDGASSGGGAAPPSGGKPSDMESIAGSVASGVVQTVTSQTTGDEEPQGAAASEPPAQG